MLKLKTILNSPSFNIHSIVNFTKHAFFRNKPNKPYLIKNLNYKKPTYPSIETQIHHTN